MFLFKNTAFNFRASILKSFISNLLWTRVSIQHFKKWDENNYARVKLCLFFVDKQLKQHAFENTHLKNCWLEISTLLEITFKSNWNVPHTSFLKLDPWMYHSWEAISAPHSCAIVRVLFKSNDFNISKISHSKGRQFFNQWQITYKYPSWRSVTKNDHLPVAKMDSAMHELFSKLVAWVTQYHLQNLKAHVSGNIEAILKLNELSCK